jgi:hypothetical protein
MMAASWGCSSAPPIQARDSVASGGTSGAPQPGGMVWKALNSLDDGGGLISC